MQKLMDRYPRMQALLRNTAGATAVEYGLLAAIVVVGLLGALQALADENIFMWAKVSSNVLESSNKLN